MLEPWAGRGLGLPGDQRVVFDTPFRTTPNPLPAFKRTTNSSSPIARCMDAPESCVKDLSPPLEVCICYSDSLRPSFSTQNKRHRNSQLPTAQQPLSAITSFDETSGLRQLGRRHRAGLPVWRRIAGEADLPLEHFSILRRCGQLLLRCDRFRDGCRPRKVGCGAPGGVVSVVSVVSWRKMVME